MNHYLSVYLNIYNELTGDSAQRLQSLYQQKGQDISYQCDQITIACNPIKTMKILYIKILMINYT